MTTTSPGDRRRWRWLVGVSATLVAVVVLVSACGGRSGGDVPPDTTVTTDTTEVDGATTTVAPAPTTVPPVSVAPPATVVTTVPETTTTTTEVPQPDVPSGSIPDSSETEACEAIVERLVEYRELAVANGVNGLVSLQFGLEEFENEIDFISKQQDWGLLMLEQLYQVRREWSTAYSAAQSGDSGTADEHFELALDYLDAAIEVPCP